MANIAFCQSYDIRFDVIEEARLSLGSAWDYNFTPRKAMTVNFDGKKLTVNYKESGKNFLACNIDEIKCVEEFDKYDKTKLKSKLFILRTNEGGYYLYYIIKYEYLFSSLVKSIHIPYMVNDGKIFSYEIMQSNLISL